MSSSQPPDPAPPTIKRLRLSRACDRCRKRKVKCDEGHPCQSCQLARTACTFVEAAPAPKPKSKSRDREKKNIAELEARMCALEKVLESIPPSISQAALSKLDTALTSESTLAFRKRSVEGVPKSRSGVSEAVSNDKGDTDLADKLAALSISPSYLYLDHEGNPAWAGSTSGLPLIDMLNSRSGGFGGGSASEQEECEQQNEASPQEDAGDEAVSDSETYFPGRKAQQIGLEPVLVWTQVCALIPIDLMNTLIRTYLATTHLLWPFLHIPTFLQDYATPSVWGEPGFASLVVSICIIASRHIDDPRVRSDPADPSSSGRQYLRLYEHLRELQNAHGGTGSGNVYYIQSTFLVAIYLIGSGKLGRAFAMLAKSITLSIDSGLHRSLEHYDLPLGVWMEIRKRTFWSIFCWDKQAAAAFGRPPMIRLRDCDLDEPLDVDDESLSDALSTGSVGKGGSRIRPFIHMIRLHVVLERVLDGVNTPPIFKNSSFLTSAASIGQHGALADAEALLAEWRRQLPPDLQYVDSTTAGNDAYRLTQSERIHCLEQLARMLVYRHRFSAAALSPIPNADKHHYHHAAQQAALTIIAAHSHISRRGLLTHYGVHVIHQLTQAGRTLVAVVLQSRRAEARERDNTNSISVSLEGLRVAVGLLRQFAIRYGCGARSSDVLVEFCRVCQIPVEDKAHTPGVGHAWLRPVPLKVDKEREGSSSGRGRRKESKSPGLEGVDIDQQAEYEWEQEHSPSLFAGLDLHWDSNAESSTEAALNLGDNFLPNSTSSHTVDLDDLTTNPTLPTTNTANSAADILNLLNTGRFDVDALLGNTNEAGRVLDGDDLGMLAPPGAESFMYFAPEF